MHAIARAAALLLLGAVATLGVAVGAAAPAYACTCAERGAAQQTRSADLVMVGTLSGVKRSVGAGTSGKGPHAIDYTFRSERFYKGDTTDQMVTVTGPADPGSCGLGDPPTDREYLVFAVERQGEYRTNQCSGTARASDAALADVEGLLGPGSAAAPAALPAPDLTRVDQDQPVGFPRLAAPGAALVLLGVLGLVLVRRMGR